MTESVLPLVTVVAPCRNERRFVRAALESILNGNYPPDRMEVLVVDGMSTDGTREIVREMADGDSRIRLIDNPARIVPVAMNLGIRQARGDYIIRIDCHAEFAADYVRSCMAVALRTGADNVGGYGVTLPGAQTPTARAIAAATSCVFGVGNSTFRLTGPEQEVDTVPFGTYRKEIFDRVGLYDERLVRNQDIELNQRIRKAGGRIVISPEIKLRYYNRATYRGLWQQSFNNGLWNPYTVWLTGGGLSWRHFVPMAFVSSLPVLGAGSIVYWLARILLAAELMVYLSTAVFFAIRCSRGRPDVSATRVLWAFIVTHVAYGLGSIWGVLTIPFRFPRRTPRQPGRPLADRMD